MLCQIFTLATLIAAVYGHGRLISPPGRSTMWRYGYNTPKNYNDNQMSCGGFYKQWTLNGGQCGVCGDPWNEAHDNEAGGKYATGTIVSQYKTGQNIQVKVQITATHRGYFEFRLCPVNNPRQTATQACLDRNVLKQSNGQSRFYEPGAIGTYTVDLILPQGLTCTQCVLQWKWNTGNSYNCDNNHNCCIGCGPQEQFYGCADIAISSSGTSQFSNTGVHQGRPVGFLPISGQNVGTCQATPLFKSRYRYADQYCVSQCNQNKCPPRIYCTDACRSH
ncbi:unnamed protein product [Mytilus edulis]|uniref:Chitin-binding type-4 domain-containing protein n=1 Tax=Mytilus edulis TaxID=6550 RepID=A0A8S3T545_MYTED|nr:unnamed protein product [Mytilus edulis]